MIPKMENKNAPALLASLFLLKVKGRELALFAGLEKNRAAFIIRSGEEEGGRVSVSIRGYTDSKNESRGLVGRGEIAVDEHKRGLMAVSRLALPTLRRLVRLHFCAVHCQSVECDSAVRGVS